MSALGTCLVSIVRGQIGERVKSASVGAADVSVQVVQGVKWMMGNNVFY